MTLLDADSDGGKQKNKTKSKLQNILLDYSRPGPHRQVEMILKQDAVKRATIK